MRKEVIILSLFLFLVIGLVGCAPQIQEPLCKGPYFEYKAGDCCLDKNNNSICDSDEMLVEPQSTIEEQNFTEQPEESAKPIEPVEEMLSNISEEVLAEEEIIEEQPVEKYVGGPLTDEIYEYTTRKYYYDETDFGVVEPDYNGPAKNMVTDKSFTMRVLNIVKTPKKKVHVQLNQEIDTYEFTGLLAEGESYISRDGIRIAINKIHDKTFEFTLKQVSKEDRIKLYSDCIPFEQIRENDGIHFPDLVLQSSRMSYSHEYTYKYDNHEYSISIHDIDKERNEILFQFDNEIIPLLPEKSYFVLKTGQGIKLLYTAPYLWEGNYYGYAGFCFTDSKELPDSVLHPNYTHFVYLFGGTEKQTRSLLLGSNSEEIYLQKVMDKIVLSYKDSKADLKKDELVKINDDLSATLLTTKEPYKIGLLFKEGVKPAIYCKDHGSIMRRAAKIELQVGTSEVFEREDYCVDENTLAEYYCEEIPGVSHDKSTGKGYTAKIKHTNCTCVKGVCRP